MDSQETFIWKCEPQAEKLIESLLDEAIAANPDVANLQKDLAKLTSSRLFDWLDHIIAGQSPELETALDEAGFVVELVSSFYRVYHHLGAQLPRLIVRDDAKQSVVGIAVLVESISDFLMVRAHHTWIEGSPLSGYRRCLVSTENDVSLFVVERRGTLTVEPTYSSSEQLEKYLEALEKWQIRPRLFENPEGGLAHAILLAEQIVQSIGPDLAASVILEVERKYWQERNTAGQHQKQRQDRVGMGWANHDHHTFRSSRHLFPLLVRLFEILGFHCRERFYAGDAAGWGAQVMENPRAKLVLFLDVDLSPSEIEVDFAHKPLPELAYLGTIGLWCALHGDSILEAGMHHLEAQFLFEELTNDLHRVGIGMMEPFSNFPYLKQAFTTAEIWPVRAEKVNALLKENKITKEQADKFLAHGTLGSHLENLQRREGYKGFNQKNVSVIIKKTDPRAFT